MAKRKIKTCEEEHPEDPECWQVDAFYEYDDEDETCSGCWPGSVPVNIQPATSGPCPGHGIHFRCVINHQFQGTGGC